MNAAPVSRRAELQAALDYATAYRQVAELRYAQEREHYQSMKRAHDEEARKVRNARAECRNASFFEASALKEQLDRAKERYQSVCDTLDDAQNGIREWTSRYLLFEREEKQAEEQAWGIDLEEKQEERQRRYESFGHPERDQSNANSSTPPLRPKTVGNEVAVDRLSTWREVADNALADYSAIEIFPTPPGGCCDKLACRLARKDRALEACDCQIRAAFIGIDPSKERLLWHPDKFGKCPPRYREAYQKMAGEVFRVLQAMYDSQKESAN